MEPPAPVTRMERWIKDEIVSGGGPGSGGRARKPYQSMVSKEGITIRSIDVDRYGVGYARPTVEKAS